MSQRRIRYTASPPNHQPDDPGILRMDDTAPAPRPRDDVYMALLELRASMPFTALLVTVEPQAGGPHLPVINVGMTEEHVRFGLDHFIPHDESYQLAVARPDELYDWDDVASFRSSDVAREHLVARGYTQGISFPIRSRQGVGVGSLHVNISHAERFSSDEKGDLDQLRSQLQRPLELLSSHLGAGLSAREAQVVQLIVLGLSNQQIGERLHLAHSTVATLVQRLLTKMSATNRVQLAVIARELHLG